MYSSDRFFHARLLKDYHLRRAEMDFFFPKKTLSLPNTLLLLMVG